MLPYSLDRLPTSVAGVEHIHISPISVKPTLNIAKTQDTYELVSGVIADFTTIKDTNHVIGSSTILRYNVNGHDQLYMYSPNDSKRTRNYRTINTIKYTYGMTALSQNCIVLMYRLTNDITKGNLSYAGT
jgi:hypothetical protein